MQAAPALMMRAGAGPDTDDSTAPTPIERLPDELLELLLCFVDSKTLLMAVPAVSVRREGGVAMPSSRPGSAR